MKYAVDMGSCDTIYHVHTEFYKDWFRHSEVDRQNTQTQKRRGRRSDKHILGIWTNTTDKLVELCNDFNKMCKYIKEKQTNLVLGTDDKINCGWASEI
jgi:hypothetical protein